MPPGGRRSRLSASPSTETTPVQDEVSLRDISSSIGSPLSVQSVRGPTRGVDISTYVKVNGRIEIFSNPQTRQQEGKHCARLASECGVIVRTLAPLRVESWGKIPWDQRLNMFRRLEEYFILDFTATHVLEYLNHTMSKIYSDYRCKQLKPVYKRYPSGEAHRHPPQGISQEDWDYLCDLWGSEQYEKKCSQNSSNRSKLSFNHRAGSKPFYAHRQEHSQGDASSGSQNFPDHFQATHYNDKHGWISAEAETAHQKLVELHQQSLDQQSLEAGVQSISDEDLSRQVFGGQSRYVKGLAKRKRARDLSVCSSSTETTLQNELNSTRSELHSTQSELQQTKSLLQSTVSELQKLQSAVSQIDDFRDILVELAPHRFTPSSS